MSESTGKTNKKQLSTIQIKITLNQTSEAILTNNTNRPHKLKHTQNLSQTQSKSQFTKNKLSIPTNNLTKKILTIPKPQYTQCYSLIQKE